MDYEHYCRICMLYTSHLQRLDLFKATVGDCEMLAVEFLQQITKLKILESESPSYNLCKDCFDKLQNTYGFIQNCISSHDYLQNVIMNKNDNSKIENKDNQNNDRISKQYGNEIEKYMCNKCGAFCSSKTKFLKHTKTHCNNYVFKCNECSQAFLKKVHLHVHMRSHLREEDKKFCCKICHKQFIYKYLLKQHEYKHSNAKPFPCKICSRGCLTSESLKRHMKIHDNNYVKKKHFCQICFKEFDYPSFLAEHMKNHTGEKPYLCSICGKSFRQSGGLHYHQRVHTGYKPFMCKICDTSFISQSVLKVHMRKHTDERPYVCHICGMAFRQSTDLKGHERTHTGEKPALCTICGKRLSTTGQLTIHIRTHTGEKPFSCQFCAKAFTTKTMLIKHHRTHTGERPYVCEICGKAFNQSGTLKTHRNTHSFNPNTKALKQKDKQQKIENFNNSDEFEISNTNHDVRNLEVKFNLTILPAPISSLHNVLQ